MRRLCVFCRIWILAAPIRCLCHFSVSTVQMVTTLSRLAQLTKASHSVLTRQLSAAEGYEMRLYPAWDNFPQWRPLRPMHDG